MLDPDPSFLHCLTCLDCDKLTPSTLFQARVNCLSVGVHLAQQADDKLSLTASFLVSHSQTANVSSNSRLLHPTQLQRLKQ